MRGWYDPAQPSQNHAPYVRADFAHGIVTITLPLLFQAMCIADCSEREAVM